ncbi:MAG: cyclic nucleotide-binding domain-containing protein, partial [Dokdonella sp.]
YSLADPEAFNSEDIAVVGAGDAAIENALALSAANRVSLINRGSEFARAKDANVALIQNAIKSGKIKCYFDTTISKITPTVLTLNTPQGEVELKCGRIIARLGSILPRKFIESCGVQFPNSDPNAVPVVSERYESNVSGLYVIGSLIGYPLIKQAMNQGYEVIEHILGNAVEPADQILVAEKLRHLSSDINAELSRIRSKLPIFKDLSVPQFRELISESTVHICKKGATIFSKNDYGDTFFNVIDGAVAVELSAERSIEISSGYFFGEMGLLSGRRRTATIRSGSGETVLLETPRKQILKLISSVASVKEAIDNAFALRVLQTTIFPDAEYSFNEKLANCATTKLFRKNEVLFREGDPGDVLYILRKGSVKVSRINQRGADVAQTYIPAGNYVGEMSLLSEETLPRSATVTAAVPCETLVIAKKDFLELLTNNPKTRERILRLAEERRLKNSGGMQETQFGLMLDFLLKEGVSDADNVLVIDSDLCIGCDNCEKACAATHSGYSRLDRKGGQSFASIQVPVACRHCENPLCMLD